MEYSAKSGSVLGRTSLGEYGEEQETEGVRHNLMASDGSAETERKSKAAGRGVSGAGALRCGCIH